MNKNKLLKKFLKIKNDKEKYFETVKHNYGEEERKAIKPLLKSNLTLEQLQDCILPIMDYTKQETIMERKMNGMYVSEDYGKRKLKADEITEIANCYKEGLTGNQVTSIINGNFQIENINAEFIKLSKEAFKKGMNEHEFYKIGESKDIDGIKEILNVYRNEYPKELIDILSKQDSENKNFIFNKEYRKSITNAYENNVPLEKIKNLSETKLLKDEGFYETQPKYSISEFKKEMIAFTGTELEKEAIKKYKELKSEDNKPIFFKKSEFDEIYQNLPEEYKEDVIVDKNLLRELDAEQLVELDNRPCGIFSEGTLDTLGAEIRNNEEYKDVLELRIIKKLKKRQWKQFLMKF